VLQGTVSRVRDLEVTGLADDDGTAMWNGSGSGTMSHIRQTRDGGEVQMDMTSGETATDVVIPVPRRMARPSPLTSRAESMRAAIGWGVAGMASTGG
jgi:hypothetical protein